MAVQIGAKIGLQGEQEYRKAIQGIISDTKKLKQEFKEVESSFNNTKTFEGVQKQRENLNKQLEETTKILQKQQEVLDKARQHNANAEQNIGLNWDADNNPIDPSKLAKYESNIANTRIEINRLKNEIENLPSAIKIASDAFNNATSDWGSALSGIGDTLTRYVTVPLTLLGGVSLKSFADWESAFTGVRKTVEGSEEDFAKIASGITDIALATASSREDIAGVAEVAGQLGVATEDILGFTEVMVKLGDSTNLAADEAATALARVFNITGLETTQENVEKIGNSIVHLGNNYATTESEIVHMTNRLAAGGTLAGLTTQEILGLATAMSSVGITAEAGGTAMTQTLTKIEKEFSAFSKGAESDLPRIAEIAGMSAEAFANAWENEPAKAIQAFISGLGGLDEQGESATLVLDELDMAGIRQSNMLKSLALASDVMTEAIKDSNEAYENGNDLTDEATKRYKTLDTQTHQLGESFKILFSEIGSTIAEMILPAVEGITKFVKAMADGWKGLPTPIKEFLVVVGGIVAALGPVFAIVGGILTFVTKVKAAMTALGITIGALSGGILGIVAVIAGVAAAIVFVINVIRNWDQIVEFSQKVFEAFGEALQMFGELVSGIFGLLRDWIVQKVTEIRESIIEKFTQAKDNVIQKVTQIKDGVVNYFTQAKNNAITLFTNLKDSAVNLFENMKVGISNKVGEIKSAIVNGITNAINWIKSLPSQAYSWGADMMSSMASGIRNAVGSVVNAVSGIASRVRSYLHFSEPDVGPLSDFHTYMPDMMKMMAKGITDNSYLVENALSNLTGTMSSDLQSAQPNYNYGGVVINLNVPEGANGRMLVDEIENELAQRTIRRKAVFG